MPNLSKQIVAIRQTAERDYDWTQNSERKRTIECRIRETVPTNDEWLFRGCWQSTVADVGDGRTEHGETARNEKTGKLKSRSWDTNSIVRFSNELTKNGETIRMAKS